MEWHGTGTMRHHFCFVLSSTKPIKTLKPLLSQKRPTALLQFNPFLQFVLEKLNKYFVVGTTSLSVSL